MRETTMLHNLNVVLLLIVSLFLCSNTKTINGANHSIRQFPKGFLFGTATASYQVEGAWDSDGKAENIWDHLTHNDPCRIKDCSNGDIANDSYNNYERDVEMTRELGLDFYRFSLSWSRILPTSFPDKINEAGVQYYNNLIDELLKYNIEPMVTLYHWDLPQKLQEMGGWTNPHIVDWYVDYARIVFENFGDRIKYWITMNEPREICYQGYGDTTMAPALNIKGIGEYLCAKNLLVAHAKVYRIYEEEFKPKYGGLIGITLSGSWTEPESEKYAEAADDVIQFEMGIYAHPIFSEAGDFPQIMKEKVAEKSANQGFYRSRLPEFTKEEIEMIRGSSDFFGLNHYSSNIAYKNASINFYDEPSSNDDLGVASYKSPDWSGSASSWLKSVPWGFYKLLRYITNNYNNPNIIITENGFSTYGGLEDDDRITYFRQYLDAILDAIEDGCNVTAYTAWSLMDNFEWMQGYVERFGLYEVDYSSPDLTRTPRKSAFMYKNIISTRSLNHHFEPDTTVMSIDEGH